MWVWHAESVDLGAGRTLEAALQGLVLGPALFAVGLSGPIADALVLVEPEAGRTGVFLGDAFDAGEENVADALVGMSVEAVEAGAKVVGAFRGLQFESVAAIDVEVVVAGLSFAAERVKDQAVGAETLLGDAVVTFVVFVALPVVLVGAVGLGTDELLSCIRAKKRF